MEGGSYPSDHTLIEDLRREGGMGPVRRRPEPFSGNRTQQRTGPTYIGREQQVSHYLLGPPLLFSGSEYGLMAPILVGQ